MQKRWLQEQFPGVAQPTEEEMLKYGTFTSTPPDGPNPIKELWENSIAGGVTKDALEEARKLPFLAYEMKPGDKIVINDNGCDHTLVLYLYKLQR